MNLQSPRHVEDDRCANHDFPKGRSSGCPGSVVGRIRNRENRFPDRRREDSRYLPQVRHFGCDLLQIQGKVRRHDGVGRPAAEDAGGRKLEAEASSGGCDAGHCCPEEPGAKKLLTPDAKRKAVHHVMEAHGLSERRACRLADLDRSTFQYEKRDGGDETLRQRL